MDRTPECSDCNTSMEKGFIPDFSHYTQSVHAIWHPGEPENISFLGFQSGKVHVERSEGRKIIAYRCPHCGLLRSYAE